MENRNELVEMEEESMVICEFCGKEIPEEEAFVFNGITMCHDCEEENIVVCDNCGECILTDDSHYRNGDVLCEDCYDEYYPCCDRCGERTYVDYMYNTDNGESICEYCRDEYYAYCDVCDALHDRDEMYFDEYEERWYCEDCYNERSRTIVIKQYSYKPYPIFYGRQTPDFIRDNTLYLGTELEIDKGGENHENAKKLLDIVNADKEHIYCKHDGSISCGFEIVSHPATLEYHKNNIAWAALMEKATTLGYRSHDTETCGLHIHVSRDSLGDTYGQREDTISRIIYFIENNWDQILTFTRRTQYSLDRWARRYGLEKDVEETYEKVKNGSNRFDRYMCINLQNTHTVEFRMFRGTLKHSTFMATLQLVHLICTMCKCVDMQTIEKMAWYDFVSTIDSAAYPELTEYLKNRNLYI